MGRNNHFECFEWGVSGEILIMGVDYKLLLLGEFAVIIFSILRAKRKIFVSPFTDINSSDGLAATFNFWFLFGNILLLFLFTFNFFALLFCIGLLILRGYIKGNQNSSKSFSSKPKFSTRTNSPENSEDSRIHIKEKESQPSQSVPKKLLTEISMPVKVSDPPIQNFTKSPVPERNFRVIENIPKSTSYPSNPNKSNENINKVQPVVLKTISVKTKKIYCDGCEKEYSRNRFYELGIGIVYLKCKICSCVMKRSQIN